MRYKILIFILLIATACVASSKSHATAKDGEHLAYLIRIDDYIINPVVEEYIDNSIKKAEQDAARNALENKKNIVPPPNNSAPDIMLIGPPTMYATNMSEVEGQDDILIKYSQWLKVNLRRIKSNGDYIFARGSCDIRGGEILNLKLGKKRAYSGAEFLVRAGIMSGFTAEDFEGVLFRVHSSYDEPLYNKKLECESNWKERRCDFFVANQKTGEPRKIAMLLNKIEKGGK